MRDSTLVTCAAINLLLLLRYFLHRITSEAAAGAEGSRPESDLSRAHMMIRVRKFRTLSVTLKEQPMSLAPLSEELPTQSPPEDSGGERPASNRRIQANRKNALRSTGPKSKRGKDAAARNSLKHGLLAKSAVVLVGPAKEDKAEFEGLLNDLRDYFHPLGIMEELLVQEIAVSYWKERRAQLSENGEIHKQVRSAVSDELWKEADYDGGISELLVASFGNNRRLLTSSQGLRHVLGTLARIREEVEATGQASEESLKQLSEFCGGDWQSVAGKSEMLAELQREKERLARLKKKVERFEAEDRDAKLQRALLPCPNDMEMLLRYSAANERRRYRALAQLERLQRQRSGEVLPAPIDVQVTSDAGDFAKRSQ